MGTSQGKKGYLNEGYEGKGKGHPGEGHQGKGKGDDERGKTGKGKGGGDPGMGRGTPPREEPDAKGTGREMAGERRYTAGNALVSLAIMDH